MGLIDKLKVVDKHLYSKKYTEAKELRARGYVNIGTRRKAMWVDGGKL